MQGEDSEVRADAVQDVVDAVASSSSRTGFTLQCAGARVARPMTARPLATTPAATDGATAKSWLARTSTGAGHPGAELLAAMARSTSASNAVSQTTGKRFVATARDSAGPSQLTGKWWYPTPGQGIIPPVTAVLGTVPQF